MSRRRVERLEIKRVRNGFILTVDGGLSRHEVLTPQHVMVAETPTALSFIINEICWEDFGDE